MDFVLSDIQLDIIKELMNVGVNESTNILSHILNTEIELNVPVVRVLKAEELLNELELLGSSHLTAVNLEFENGFSGTSQLVFSQESANKLVSIFSREVLENEDIDELNSGALIEIGNIVLNAVLAEFSNFLHHEFNFFVPDFYENYENDFYSKIYKYSDDIILLGQTLFSIEEYQIKGDIVLFMKIESFNQFISLIDNYLNTL
jgi:chemotaxis protein CheC